VFVADGMPSQRFWVLSFFAANLKGFLCYKMAARVEAHQLQVGL
jgi:hypothetical protein